MTFTLLATFWIVLASSLSGLALASRLRWSDAARAASLDRAVGLALAPFITGLAVVAVLWLMPGALHRTHVLVVAGLVACGVLAGWPRGDLPRLPWFRGGPAEWALLAVLLAFPLAQLYDLAYVPLIQNDALEYATVARILFDARDLAAYPAISPQATASGFFGPWTHPPLYVAMLYLADAIQGQAQSALALRLVAPWFLAVGTLCVLSLGNMVSRLAGLVAAVVFVSTPILFLGASSALIDPLPVLGMALAFAALIGLEGSPVRRGLGLGVMLGLALWTHSQAILFPFLMLPLLLMWPSEGRVDGLLARLRVAGLAAVCAVVAALLVGGAPYVRNVLLFGSPISDNPEVFAYAPLGFADYFRMQRGISDPVEIIQYGVLKGFFAFEAYSFAFWLAVLGLPRAGRALWRQLTPGAAAQPASERLLAGALGVFISYTAATAVSSALGIDLMIKNERYMLVLIPCIAVLGGAGLVIRQDVAPGWASRLRLVATLGVLALMPAQLLALVSYRQSQLRGEPVAWDESAQLRRWPHFEVMRYLRDETPKSALVLTMKPADMFYADRKMVSYLDPRLLPYYAERDSDEAAWRRLRSLGISHVHMTDYLLPPVYMSRLMHLAADPRYMTLVSDSEGYQIYALAESGGQAPVAAPQALPMGGDWHRETQLVLGGRKSRARHVLERQPHALGTRSENDGFLGLFHRESARVLFSPPVDLAQARRQCGSGAASVVVSTEFVGKAHVALLAIVRDAQGAIVERRTLGDRPAMSARTTEMVRLMPLPVRAASLTLAVEHRGASWLRLDRVTVALQCDAPG
jgi:4-amino-4-deoxy-L-arabinose transferase-like glycosyltransferase